MSITPFGPITTAGTFQYKISQILGGRTDTRVANAIKDGINYATRELDRRLDAPSMFAEWRFTTMAQSNTLTSGTDFTITTTTDLYQADLSAVCQSRANEVWKVEDEDAAALTEVSSLALCVADGDWYYDKAGQLLYIFDETNDLSADPDVDQTMYVRSRYTLPLEYVRRSTLASGATSDWAEASADIYSQSFTHPPVAVYEQLTDGVAGTFIVPLTRATSATVGDGEWYWATGTLYVGNTTDNLTTDDDRDVYVIIETVPAVKTLIALRRQDTGEGGDVAQIPLRGFEARYPFPEDEASGEPAWFIHSEDYIEIAPPSDDTYSMNMRYVAWSPPLSNDYDLVVYDHMDDVIVAFAACYAYETLQEEESAMAWLTEAEKRFMAAVGRSNMRPSIWHTAAGYRTSSRTPTGEYWRRLDLGRD